LFILKRGQAWGRPLVCASGSATRKSW